MIIGINAAAAFKTPRTGVEEYCYQIIKHLAMLEESKKHRFVLYGPKKETIPEGWDLPENFEIKLLNAPFMWTQMRLAAHLFKSLPNVLFIPVHVLPLVHPFNSVVTIHGLEYEHYPELYPKKHLRYLRLISKFAVKRAKTIIAVSKSTKEDLVKLYGADPEIIEVVYHGASENKNLKTRGNHKYILSLGRLEKKKNPQVLISAFRILKEKYNLPHKLIIAGPEGFGVEEIKSQIDSVPQKKDIFVTGYLSEEEKQYTVANASVFVSPSFCEGFDIPVLEAMKQGVPLVLSKIPVHEEIAGDAALFFNPNSPEDLAEKINQVLSNNFIKGRLSKQGQILANKFTWQRAAQKTLKILTAL